MATVQAIRAEGAAAWPGIAVDLPALEAFLAMRPEATASAVDLYLACACTLGIPEALDAFVRVYLAPIEQALGSLRRSVDPDEVRQLLAIHLVLGDADRPAKIREYRGRGALAGWVRIAAVRTALDLARRTSRERSDDDAFDDAVADLAVDGELELELVRNRYAEHFRGGFREALQRTAAPDRALLRLHYLEGMTTAAMAALYRVSRPTIVRRLAEARGRVFEATAEVIKGKLDLATADYAELLGMMRGNLEITVERMMSGD